ncbi:MAG: hypothetical protein CSA20_05895 [Deltaproteobacteria bacterium]|nr:MAG: hypothetical protein CSA20_05895 [Deltaproteobacteria bacterium]
MWRNILWLLLLCGLLSLISGCYNKPVRHLAADVGLVKVGVSTKDDVLVFLGNPDEEFVGEDGTLNWIYLKSRKTVAEKLPWLGEKIGSPERTRVAVQFQGDVVSRVDYSLSDSDDLRWEKNVFPEG